MVFKASFYRRCRVLLACCVLSTLFSWTIKTKLSIVYHESEAADTPRKFQIHFKPLKYTTTELQEKLDDLKLDDSEVAARIEEQLHICSYFETGRDNSSVFYQELMSSILETWHDFIPPHQDMISSQCWYTDTFKKISPSLESNFSEWNSFYYMPQRYPKSELTKIFSTIIGPKQRAVFHKYNTSSETKKYNNFFCVPKFYLGGFSKCGTTTLFNYLTAHHNIVKPTKEPQFWREFVAAEDNDYRHLAVIIYLYHYKRAANMIKGKTEEKFTLDGSATTIFANPKRLVDIEKDMCVVPLLLSKVLPSTKLIFIMRDPVQRLWSDYWYFCSKDHFNSDEIPQELLERSSEMFHNHSITVVESFIDCITQGQSEFECVMLAHCDKAEDSACKSARVGISLYYFHVIRWLSVFPRNQLLFLTLEDLNQNTYSVLERVWKFLSLSPLPQNQLPKQVTTNSNEWIKSEKYRDKFKMWPETNRILRSFFHPYNTRLAKLLQDDQFLWEK